MTFWFGLVGAIVIGGLTVYAGYLLFQLYQQKQRHQRFLEKAQARQLDKMAERNKTIMESVLVIATASKQQQCDLSEAAIRLYKLMEVLQGEKRVDFRIAYPSLCELYDVVKDMPRGEERQQQEKQARMQNNLIRVKAEARLQDAIAKELDAISQLSA